MEVDARGEAQRQAAWLLDSVGEPWGDLGGAFLRLRTPLCRPGRREARAWASWGGRRPPEALHRPGLRLSLLSGVFMTLCHVDPVFLLSRSHVCLISFRLAVRA